MKNFNAKYITRTITYSCAWYIKADVKSMKMENTHMVLNGTFKTDKELLEAVKERDEMCVAIESVETITEKRRMSIADFILNSEVIEDDTSEAEE